jgi:hypothetical protein
VWSTCPAGRRDRLWRSFDMCDPTKQIQAAWAVKERLRLLLKQREPSKIRRWLTDLYEAAIDANLPEATDSPRPSRPGGRQSWSPSPTTSATPAPRASTG